MVPQDPYAQQRKKEKLFLGIGATVLTILLVVGVGFGVLAARGAATQPVLAQKGKTQPVLQQQAAPPKPVLQDEAAAPAPVLPDATEMPRDVAEWLEHLRKTEEKRSNLSKGQLGMMTTMLVQMKAAPLRNELRGLMGGEEGEAPLPETTAPTADFKAKAKEAKQEWLALSDFFMSKSAPAECLPIQAAYRTALGETSGMMVEILEALATSSENPEAAVQALTKMQGTSSQRIDANTKKADQLVQDICDKYKVRKWFSLASDFGSGLLDRLGGLGAGF